MAGAQAAAASAVRQGSTTADPQGEPTMAQVAAAAAENNDLRMFKFLTENGCKWDARIREYAGGHATARVLSYALQFAAAWEYQEEPEDEGY